MDWFLYDIDLRHERVNKHYEDSNVGFMIVHQIPVNPQFLLSKLCWPLHYISSYKKFAYKIVLSEILTFKASNSFWIQWKVNGRIVIL